MCQYVLCSILIFHYDVQLLWINTTGLHWGEQYGGGLGGDAQYQILPPSNGSSSGTQYFRLISLQQHPAITWLAAQPPPTFCQNHFGQTLLAFAANIQPFVTAADILICKEGPKDQIPMEDFNHEAYMQNNSIGALCGWLEQRSMATARETLLAVNRRPDSP